MTMSERGEQLRTERQRRKLSLYEVAKRAGCHPNSVALAERGASSEAMIRRIGATLGVESAELHA